MDPKYWQEIKTILDEAMDLPADRVDQWLEARCAGDIKLISDVKALLNAEEEVGFEQPLGRAELQTSSIGKRIGPYQIQDRLGVAEDCTTYLAIKEGSTKRIRLRVARVSAGSDLMLRLDREIHIRQQLEHIHICNLLDSDILDQSVIYMAEEYTEHHPQLTIPQLTQDGAHALDRFKRVCEGICYAHRLQIVHGNIHADVLGYDDDGQIKIQGFGGSYSLTKLMLTSEGPRLAVSPHLSPEVARGAEPGLRTDVYALGALLYFWLTGKHPYNLNARTSSQIRKMLYAEAAVEPSSLVPDAQWPKTIDAVVLKALAKDPRDRFSDADNLFSAVSVAIGET